MVIERAQGCCEYCLLHQDDTQFAHQIDHLIAIKHGGQTDRDNLALACLKCNRYKGSDLTAIDPVDGVIVQLFNPRVQAWREHFALDGARLLVGFTQTGRATAALLRMNDRSRLMQRRRLIVAGRYPPTHITL
ncbi:MAG: HNH endonuclease signature motif containing protein [Pyrinomonadaceae bacterium]